jgi:thiopeptide-type bacteriocin biosynthesis protein
MPPSTSASRSRSGADAPHVLHAGFAVLRTPLLPFDEYARWAALRANVESHGAPEDQAAALERDYGVLRDHLRALFDRPALRDALFVASPELHRAAAPFLAGETGGGERRVVQSLARYLARAATRPTPFGLFAGCSVLPIGAVTSLQIEGAASYRRHSRLDMDYVAQLARAVGNDPAARRAVPLRANTSLHAAGGRIHYVETVYLERLRRYLLVAADPAEALRATLERARRGADFRVLAGALADAEVSLAEAEEYVEELLDAQVLMPGIEPAITGREAAAVLADDLAAANVCEPVAAALAETLARLRTLDAEGVGARVEGYARAAEPLAGLPVQVDRARLYQVDLFKPAAASASLGADVVAEIARGAELLARVFPQSDPLDDFMERFMERYERREVPLLEALDEEVGIALGAGQTTAAAQRRLQAAHTRDLWLAELRVRAAAAGAGEVELEESDILRLDQRPSASLPEAFGAMATLMASSPEALARGDFRVLLHNVMGPPGAALLGRFCHLDAGLGARTEEYLRMEEALRPDAVFAEVVHLPQGRVGNVIARPTFRGYEIPFLGRPSLPPDRQILPEDLTVSVVNRRLVLRSRRLGREVVPRLTCAHTFSQPAQLPVYRFLGLLQAHGTSRALSWQWGGHLNAAAFLPRVTAGRLVLARARWTIFPQEVETLTRVRGAEGYDRVRRWAEQRKLPRRVMLAEADQFLPIDLDNVVSVHVLLDLLRRHPGPAELTEALPAAGDLCAHGPEGAFVHELVVPFTRGGAAPSPARGSRTAGTRARRTFAPGDEWLYAKLYCGPGMGDYVLRAVVEPLTRAAMASGAAGQWFFLRYSDPDHHVRVRLRGEPDRLRSEVLPLVTRLATPLLENGALSRVQLDTYQREMERYGGEAGIELSERLFHHDSEAVIAMLEGARQGGPEGERPLYALAGIDTLLAAFGLSVAERLRFVREAPRSSSDAHHHAGGEWFRRRRRELDVVFSRAAAGDWLHDAIARRSRGISEVAAQLREREAAGALTCPLSDLLISYTHMHVNRLLRPDDAVSEPVLYDVLARHYRSRLARTPGDR